MKKNPKAATSLVAALISSWLVGCDTNNNPDAPATREAPLPELRVEKIASIVDKRVPPIGNDVELGCLAVTSLGADLRVLIVNFEYTDDKNPKGLKNPTLLLNGVPIAKMNSSVKSSFIFLTAEQNLLLKDGKKNIMCIHADIANGSVGSTAIISATEGSIDAKTVDGADESVKPTLVNPDIGKAQLTFAHLQIT